MLARNSLLAHKSLPSTSAARLLQRSFIRGAATTSMTQDESQRLLQEQRRRRPNSPHLSIYKPQITWILSSLNRITGVALSGGIVFWLFHLLSNCDRLIWFWSRIPCGTRIGLALRFGYHCRDIRFYEWTEQVCHQECCSSAVHLSLMERYKTFDLGFR